MVLSKGVARVLPGFHNRFFDGSTVRPRLLGWAWQGFGWRGGRGGGEFSNLGFRGKSIFDSSSSHRVKGYMQLKPACDLFDIALHL